MTSIDVVSEVGVVHDQIKAFSAKDWDAWRRTVRADLTYEEPATGRTLTGVDQVIEGFKLWTTAFPDLKGTITGIVSSGNQVVAEIEWDGTLTGPLMAPTGKIEPTGKHGVIKAAQVFMFEEGRVTYMRHYFDMMDILRQAGALPSA